ncbi:MAG: hypothetical protein ACTSR0_03515 [Candidatus Asgardarchaeia archaeon]
MEKFRIIARREPEESLYEHIKNGLYAIRRYYLEEGYHVFLSRVSERNGNDLSEDDFKEILLLSYAFHDSGKAFDAFQRNIRRWNSAPGHELLSCLLFKESFDWSNDLKGRLCREAIYIHMKAARESFSSPYTLLKKFSRSSKTKEYRLSEESARELGSIMRDLGFEVKIKPLSFDISDAEDEFESLDEFRTDFIDLLVTLILHPLMVADEFAVKVKMREVSEGVRFRPWVENFISSVDVAKDVRRRLKGMIP